MKLELYMKGCVRPVQREVVVKRGGGGGVDRGSWLVVCD